MGSELDLDTYVGHIKSHDMDGKRPVVYDHRDVAVVTIMERGNSSSCETQKKLNKTKL